MGPSCNHKPSTMAVTTWKTGQAGQLIRREIGQRTSDIARVNPDASDQFLIGLVLRRHARLAKQDEPREAR